MFSLSCSFSPKSWHILCTHNQNNVRNSLIIRINLLYNRLECDIDIFNDSFGLFVNALQPPRPWWIYLILCKKLSGPGIFSWACCVRDVIFHCQWVASLTWLYMTIYAISNVLITHASWLHISDKKRIVHKFKVLNF